MTKILKRPGESAGEDGGIYQEVGPRGGKRENFATVKDNQVLPPTRESGNRWELLHRTPDSKR